MSEACLHFFSGFVDGKAICANCGAVLYETRDAIVERLESDLAATRQKLAEAQADCAAKADALRNLIFTATKLWDDAKPIKDGAAMRVTHPSIEEAATALASTAGGALVKELERLRAENAALRAQSKLPENYCLACGGTGGHHEGCAGTTGLIALAAQCDQLRGTVEALSADYKRLRLAELEKEHGLSANAPEPCKECESLRAQRDQAVSLARELGEVLKGSKSAMNNLAEMWSAEERGHDITSDKYDKKVQEWESKRTAALAKLAALNPPPSDDTLKV